MNRTLSRVVAALVMVLTSLAVGLLIGEVAARFVLNPADYLSVTTHEDPVLGLRIEPNAAGFDAWGFRNPRVPTTADVVALGDSHTFGNTATMVDAWPSVLSRETGLSVYNLGIGGYGPNQYYHLLKTRALSLKPRHVLVGLYLGDDFENAFSITYGLDHWAAWRTEHRDAVNPDIWSDTEPPGRFKSLRNWLSRESFVYRLVTHGPLVSAIKERVRFASAGRGEYPAVTALEIPARRIREAFRPNGLVVRLDPKNPNVRIGKSLTFRFLVEMSTIAREDGSTLSVVIIPTKEMVFAKDLAAAPHLHLGDAVAAVITHGLQARDETVAALEQAGIPYVDSLPALAAAIGEPLYAPTTEDMHPSRGGYAVIAHAAAAHVRQLDSAAGRHGHSN